MCRHIKEQLEANSFSPYVEKYEEEASSKDKLPTEEDEASQKDEASSEDELPMEEDEASSEDELPLSHFVKHQVHVFGYLINHVHGWIFIIHLATAECDTAPCITFKMSVIQPPYITLFCNLKT